ncbi:hypothetical protein [Endozoicomonas acroporae]|uniref:hypothetical protein n=1 Tax=Endozoicomonas acroporae TaxID=1701104 RepID=UPI0013D54D9F|nr:hypothetical protein [Endozoicomonas acroporae]
MTGGYRMVSPIGQSLILAQKHFQVGRIPSTAGIKYQGFTVKVIRLQVVSYRSYGSMAVPFSGYIHRIGVHQAFLPSADHCQTIG